MTHIVTKVFPTLSRGDKAYPVYIWQNRPEIIVIAIHDYLKDEKTLAEAKELTTQIMYETAHLRWEHGNDLALSRLYKGIAIFDSKKNLKTIKTRNHVIHYS
jgi:hypothetical protein